MYELLLLNLLKNLYRPLDVAYSRERSILFLSDGEPSDLPYKIFKLIYDKNKQLYNSVTLLCFALGKSTFGSALQKMAFQDFNFQNKTTCKGKLFSYVENNIFKRNQFRLK